MDPQPTARSLALVLVLILAGCRGREGDDDVGVDAAMTHIDAPPPATPISVSINFDDLHGNVTVATQYPSVTFSSDPGKAIKAMSGALGFGSSPPTFICAYDCDASTFLAFARPVSGIKLNAVGVNDTGKVADVRVFVGGALAATESIVGLGHSGTPVHVDLSTYENVTRLEIVNVTDAGGIGMDDFAFVTH